MFDPVYAEYIDRYLFQYVYTYFINNLKISAMYSPVGYKKSWNDVEKVIESLNPELFNIIDQIPDIKNHTFTEAHYPYGYIYSDNKYFHLPNEKGEITHFDAKQYPYALILENSTEIYLSYRDKSLTDSINYGGEFEPKRINLIMDDNFDPRPKSIFYGVAGSLHSAYLPISEVSAGFIDTLKKLKLPLNLTPNNYITHHEIFTKALESIQSKWRYKVLFFDFDINEKIKYNPAYRELKLYLYEQSIKNNAYISNRHFLRHAVWDILNENKLKVRPLAQELIFNSLYIALGDLPGFSPSSTQNLPTNELAEYFYNNVPSSSYPVFVSTSQKNKKDNQPTYLPLSADNLINESSQSKNAASYISEMATILPILLYEFKEHKLTKGSIFSSMLEDLKIKYYSPYSHVSKMKELSPSTSLFEDDKRFKEFESYGGKLPKRNIFSNAVISIQHSRMLGNKA